MVRHDVGRHKDGLTLASNLFKIERPIFERALSKETLHSSSPEPNEGAERLRNAMLGLRRVIPEEFFPKWGHMPLPRITESPLDILRGNNGFEEFVNLIEGIVRGDFA